MQLYKDSGERGPELRWNWAKSEVFILSHHPEIINQLAPEDGHVLFRENGGPTRIQRFSASEAMPAAEIVARGGLPRAVAALAIDPIHPGAAADIRAHLAVRDAAAHSGP